MNKCISNTLNELEKKEFIRLNERLFALKELELIDENLKDLSINSKEFLEIKKKISYSITQTILELKRFTKQ